VLHRSRILRLVVNLFVLLILHSGTQISHLPGVAACTRLLKNKTDSGLVVRQSHIQIPVSSSITPNNGENSAALLLHGIVFFILLSSNEAISGTENNSLQATKFI